MIDNDPWAGDRSPGSREADAWRVEARVFRRSLAAQCLRFALAKRERRTPSSLKKQWMDDKDGTTPLYGHLVYEDALTGKHPGALLAHSRASLSIRTRCCDPAN